MRRKEQKMKWLCVFPNKEKDRDKLFWLLWIALDQCICWIFFPLCYPSASVQLFEFQSHSLQCLCRVFSLSQEQLIILQFVF